MNRCKHLPVKLILLVWLLLLIAPVQAADDNSIISHLKFNQLSTLNGLPTNEVQKVYQDKDGFMWFATRYGLCQYDGYKVSVYKSNLYTPFLLINNDILCVADDYNHRLWFGTQEGVSVLDKETGEIRKCTLPGAASNVVSCLLVTKENAVWVGTEVGVYRYDAVRDTFQLYNRQNTDGVMPNCTTKSLMEDSDGDIWIGSWSDGLYRYSPREDKFYAYPDINDRRSAHVIYEDSHKNIWVGSWDRGLFLLHNPKDMNAVSYENFRHSPAHAYSLSDDIVYDISEDMNTGSLWVGTRSGLSIMTYDKPGRFINYQPRQSSYYIPCNEVNSILRDRNGSMWIGAIGGGVLITDTRSPKFQLHQFNAEKNELPTSAVRSLFVDNEQNMWVGVGTYGIGRHNRKTDAFQYFSQIPEFAGIQGMPTIYDIIQRRNTGELWFASYDGGIYVYKKGEKVRCLSPGNTSFIKDHCVLALYEDKAGNCWVGTRRGVGVMYPDGTGVELQESEQDQFVMDRCFVRDIVEDANGVIWLATVNQGIISISGDIRKPGTLVYKNYGLKNGKLMVNAAFCLYFDSTGNLWAGTEGGGLYLYNREKDTFCEKHKQYSIPGDMVGSIQEDGAGNLWLGTNAGLVKLTVKEDHKEATTRVYTSIDGLQDNFFIPRSSFQKDGEFFFGGYKGYNSFYPADLKDDMQEPPFYVTDIRIFNRSFSSMEEDVRKKISVKMPSFTDHVTLPYKYNNFSIEFASLTYRNPELNKYAYMLEGFDKEWQYTDATRHFAYYNNLESGTYTFLLKATNENGIWNEQVRRLKVTILPPFWATWWAYTLYALFVAVIVYYSFRVTRNRMVLRNELRLREMEKAKAEELNHTKLQFFTNITHELLTPLTIISATADEIKLRAPQHSDLYSVMSSSIFRLMRLLQQILEFRKAETGNLKLRVSPGDISAFVKNEAECFLPLIKKQKLHFSVLCDPESITGYFDTDKVDKILYNLLSNAAKYNKEGGFVQITLTRAENPDFVSLAIRDNGKGISKEKQKTLFKRFYEGDYRKFNTIGTGIGLSLVKDLVELHGGTIRVESEVDQGATFFITLPIERSYFKAEEIDEEAILPAQKTIMLDEQPDELVNGEEKAKIHSILILEDNEELLQLMVKLLGREYNVFTAADGKEGVVVVENEDIDLIVSDIMMPEMDGIEFCKYVKSKLEISHIPVILLTAKNKEEDRAEAYEVGADAFLSKPFNLTVLHARIKNLLKYKERMARDFKNQLVFEVKDLNYTSIDEEFLQRAIDCVNRHLEDGEFDQPQFIDEMGTSKSTLYKKLKSLTGLNTSAFIRNIRLKAACQIMEEKGSAVRVSELAYAVGFNDPKYFSSCFKKEFGMLPSEYLERFITIPPCT